MNKAILIGRLTKDPDLRYTTNNIPVATFTLAINRPSKNEEKETDFINIIVWRNQAENVSKYVKKGSQVAIDGRIQTRNYDAQDGTKRYVTEVVADYVQFLDTKKEAGQAPVKEEKEETDPFAEFGRRVEQEEIEISDDDLPF